MWMALVAMKTWMRDRRAFASASAAASMSSLRVRAREATVGRSIAAATALTPSKSPGEETANPASTMSTQPLELRPDLHLLVRLKRDAGRLLAVAQRRVEDRDSAAHCSSSLPPDGGALLL
jgi:hypothetical protein